MIEIVPSLISTQFGIGCFRLVRAKQVDDAGIRTDVSLDGITVTVSGGVGYIQSCPAGQLFVATALGTGAVVFSYTLEGQARTSSLSVEVVAGYDWGYGIGGDIEIPASKRPDTSIAKYSGYDKGVKRPFASLEDTYSEDTLIEVLVPEPANIYILTDPITGSLVFDVNDFGESEAAGFGLGPWNDLAFGG